MDITIKISQDYTKTPGGRYKDAGKYSGEEFREDILYPKFTQLNDNDRLIIDLDGGYGYPVSFLEESFGGLVRKCKENNEVENSEKILEKLEFISEDQPGLIPRIQSYITNAK